MSHDRGLVLTWFSEHDCFADDPWIVSLTEYVRGVLEDYKKPVVGICFGHQIIARALGARVGRGDGGWEISVDEITLTDAGKQLFGKDKLVRSQPFQLYYQTPFSHILVSPTNAP